MYGPQRAADGVWDHSAGARALWRGVSGEGGGWRGVMTLPWSTGLGAELVALEGHSDSVSAVALSVDGARLATGSYDNTAKLWDAATGEALRTFAGHSGGVYAVALSGDGARLATGSEDKTIRLWDMGGC